MITFEKRVKFLNQLDRYLLLLQIRPFIFFSLVFIGVLWLVQSLPRLDDILSNGQSGDVFIKVAVLMLPQVILLVIPLAAFAATIYSMNQLFLDAEFIIMMSVGKSSLSLTRPVIVFGLLITIILFFFSLYLVPLSQNKLKTLMFEVRQNINSQLVRHGKFFHPASGVSIYIRESNKTGEMRGIFLTDARDSDRILTYSSREAILHETKNGLILIMQDGMLQITDEKKIALMTIGFERLALSIDDFFPYKDRIFLKPTELPPLNVILHFETLKNINLEKANEYIAEAHLKLATPISALSLTVLGLTIFLVSGYNRKGFSSPIYLGIFIGLIIQASTLSLKPLVAKNLSLFWVIYVPSLFTLLCCFAILYFSQKEKVFEELS